jgi:hypothetical protein
MTPSDWLSYILYAAVADNIPAVAKVSAVAASSLVNIPSNNVDSLLYWRLSLVLLSSLLLMYFFLLSSSL